MTNPRYASKEPNRTGSVAGASPVALLPEAGAVAECEE